MTPALPTSLRGGRYVILKPLGEGAQGETFEAVDKREGRLVALKRFRVETAKAWKDVELAEREARVLATIDHPLVPRYFEHFEESDALFLVMEKVEGETLEAMRVRSGPIAEEEVRRFLTCADRALSYLHGRSSPVIHRDVKPRNVVRRPDGSYVFVDFGAVSEMMARRGSSTVVGTIGYMAPEQLQGRAMPASDVYAVGATAIAALTGKDPETLPHRGLKLDARTALAGRASEAMIATLERMLEPDPDRRATSVAAAMEWSAPPLAPAPLRVATAPAVSAASEDAAVKSIRRLMWLLWGLGWVIVPLLVRSFGLGKEAVPLAMFGTLACVFIVTWHKGAVIRAVMRAVLGQAARERESSTPAIASTPRHRVAIGEAGKVRVHASDPGGARELGSEELLGQTELSTHEARPARSVERG